MESRSCHEDIPDGVELAGQLHNAADTMERMMQDGKLEMLMHVGDMNCLKIQLKEKSYYSFLINEVVMEWWSTSQRSYESNFCDHFGIGDNLGMKQFYFVQIVSLM